MGRRFPGGRNRPSGLSFIADDDDDNNNNNNNNNYYYYYYHHHHQSTPQTSGSLHSPRNTICGQAIPEMAGDLVPEKFIVMSRGLFPVRRVMMVMAGACSRPEPHVKVPLASLPAWPCPTLNYQLSESTLVRFSNNNNNNSFIASCEARSLTLRQGRRLRVAYLETGSCLFC